MVEIELLTLRAASLFESSWGWVSNLLSGVGGGGQKRMKCGQLRLAEDFPKTPFKRKVQSHISYSLKRSSTKHQMFLT